MNMIISFLESFGVLRTLTTPIETPKNIVKAWKRLHLNTLQTGDNGYEASEVLDPF